MNTRDTILEAALNVLEEGGTAQFSTRTVCTMAGVKAPTLYHHFGSVDGLLSAALAEVFRQFLASKHSAVQSDNAETALREGWDDYVRFASARPRLYAAVMGRLLDGGQLDAAEQGNAALRARVEALAVCGKLAVSVDEGADVVWASANAASLLYVTALTRGTPAPHNATIAAIRDAAMTAILSAAPRPMPSKNLPMIEGLRRS